MSCGFCLGLVWGFGCIIIWDLDLHGEGIGWDDQMNTSNGEETIWDGMGWDEVRRCDVM